MNLFTSYPTWLLVCLLAILNFLTHCQGHGYMYEPPSRMSAWRRGYTFHTDYNDNDLNCGKIDVQMNLNGGKCGICGENWSGPRNYERPNGLFVQHNVIPRTYVENEVIHIQLILTQGHYGWNEFRICDIAKSGGVEASHECLNQNVLPDVTGKTRFYFETDQIGTFDYEVVLPEGLTCSHCLLQWKWKCGNNWGCDDLGCGKGHGDYQEEFYACADVTVLPKGFSNITSTLSPTTERPTTTTTERPTTATTERSTSTTTERPTTTTTERSTSTTTERPTTTTTERLTTTTTERSTTTTTEMPTTERPSTTTDRSTITTIAEKTTTDNLLRRSSTYSLITPTVKPATPKTNSPFLLYAPPNKANNNLTSQDILKIILG